MKVNRITIGLILNGYYVYFKYNAFVRSNALTNTFVPLGKEIRYYIDNKSYVTYLTIPIISYHSNHNIEIFNDKTFDLIMKEIQTKLIDLGEKLYPDQASAIQYVLQEPVIIQDDRIVTLIKNKPPKQDAMRALIDISDQLYDHNPRIDLRVTFYLQGKYDGDSKIPYNIQQSAVESMQYKFDEKSFYFFNDSIGSIKYDIITGNFIYRLSDECIRDERTRFAKNFDDQSVHDIKISIVALEINANYRSLIFN